jgi:putative tryptophan/tyrosine transport system substrate-binding protein
MFIISSCLSEACRSLAIAGGVALVAATAVAQDAAAPVVGVIFNSDESDLVNRATITALREELSLRGWVDGEEIELLAEYTKGYTEYLPQRLAALLAHDPAVLVSMANSATLAALEVIPDIPIVMAYNHDAEASGLIGDGNAPAARVTGVAIPETALWPAKIEILRQLDGELSDVALIGYVGTPDGMARFERAETALQELDVAVTSYRIERSNELFRAVDDAAEAGLQALLLVEGTYIIEKNRETLGFRTVSHGLPSITTARDFAEAGLLMSHGPSRADLQALVADYVVALLEGTPVADLPVHEVEAESLTINSRAMKDMAIPIPADMLASAALLD